MTTGLRTRLLLFALAAIGGAVVTIESYNFYDRWRCALEMKEGELRRTAEVVAAKVAEDLQLRNVIGLQEALEALRVNRQIDIARIYAWDGRLGDGIAGLRDSDDDPPPAPLIDNAGAGSTERVGDRLEGLFPIVGVDGKRIGLLRLGLSMREDLDDLVEDAIWSAAIALLCMLAAAAAVWRTAGTLVADIGVLVKTADAIAFGNLNAAVVIDRRDELGVLGQAIERMAAALRDHEAARARGNLELIRLTADLEDEVARRTAELSARNEDLAMEMIGRERLEADLRASEARHRAVAEISPDAVVTADAEGRIVDFNKAAEATFDYHRRDVVGRPMAELIIPEEFRGGFQAGFAVIAGGPDPLRGKRIEILAMRANGSRFPVEFVIVPVNGPDGRLLTAFMRDISQRKQQEKALHDAEQKLRELVETAQAIIWETDALTWKYSFVSQGAEAILGYPVRRWLTEPHFWPMTIHKDDRALVLKTSRENTRAGLDHELEYRALAADGRVIWLKDIVRVITDPTGKVIGLRGIKIEITSRKQVEESLRESVSGMLFVQRISRKLLVADNVNLALDEILRECIVHGSFDFGTLLLIDPDGAAVKVAASYGYRERKNIPRDQPLEDGAIPRFRSMQFTAATVYENIQSGERLRALKHERAVSALLVPIGDKESLGSLQLATRGNGPIDRRLLPLMETVGQQIGMSIQKARLLEETQRILRREAALHEINLAATSTLDLDKVVNLLADKVEQFLPFAAGVAVRLVDRSTGRNEVAAAKGLLFDSLAALRAQGKKTFADQVLARGEIIAASDAADHPDCPDGEFYRRNQVASYLGVPLTVRDRTIGTISVVTHTRQEFSADELDFMNLLAGQAAMAIHNANLFGDLERQSAQIEAARNVELRSRLDSELLAWVSHEILAADANDTWLDRVLRRCAAATGFDLGTILLLGDDGAVRGAAANYGYRDPANLRHRRKNRNRLNNPQAGALEVGRPTVWENFQGTDRLRNLQAEGARAALTAPIKWSDRPMGLLQLASRSRNKIDQREIDLVQAIAEQIAIGLQKNELLEKTRQDLQRRQLLHEVNLAVTSTLELADVGGKLLTTLTNHLNFASRLALRLIDQNTGQLFVISGKRIQGQSRDLFDLLAKEVVNRRDVFTVRDLTDDLRLPRRDRFAERGAKSYLGVPLLINDECLGVLSVTTGETKVFSAEEIELFRLVAGQAAVGVQNAQRYQDIREQKAAIEKAKEIEAAAAAKSRFLAMMSHEIRTPLNAVIGLTDLMLRSELTDDQREMAGTIKQSGSGLLQIINDVLDFSKIEAGKVAVESSPFDLIELVNSTATIMAEQARAKGLVLSFHVAADVPQVMAGDSGRIRQVLLNLISNAIKFTAQGEVAVSVDIAAANSDGMLVRFAVSDQGIGIAADAVARLFQPFIQADISTTRKFGGTGLGLAISKQLAEAMGGTMDVESEEGKGSRFWFTVQTQTVELPKTQSRAGSLPESPKSKLDSATRILLVEDNPVNQMVALRLLELLGLHADVANDGAEAVDVARWQDYDLLLMDCEMPNMDGYQATAAIRRHEADGGRRSRIIAMTANAMAGDREKCLAAGMDDYLAKPIQLETLRAVLQRIDALRER